MKNSLYLTDKERNHINMNEKLEEMSQFFNERVNSYEDHMRKNVSGCIEGYQEIAKQLPETIKSLLDLGCGTGLELDEIFKLKPELKVTGIDLSSGMLAKLKEKHADKNITLINASYLDYDFGTAGFDAAVSFETMHHFSHEEKINIYSNVCRALCENGIYLEADYMAPTQEYEDFYYAENKRIRAELGITEGFYHYDTPCTVLNQIKMLQKAGFKAVKEVWRDNNTVMLLAKK